MPEYAPKPAYRILVKHKDKTGDFTPYLTSLVFKDYMTGKTDELDIILEDSPPTPQHDGPGLWLTEWYPVKGSQIDAWLGYEGSLLECGTFEIDEITIDDGTGGTTITIKASAAAPTKAVRTKKYKSHHDKTLADIAADIAAKHGLTVVGEVPDVHFSCVCQKNESDLAFLQRMADTYGAVFTVKGDQLIFHKTESLQNAQPVLVIARKDLTSFTFTDKITVQAVKASHLDGDKEEIIKTEIEGGETGDAITIHAPIETQAQQQSKTKAASASAKAKERTATLTLEGNIKLVAGGNIELQGFGVLDDVMLIEEATHTLNKSGYSTSIEARRATK